MDELGKTLYELHVESVTTLKPDWQNLPKKWENLTDTARECWNLTAQKFTAELGKQLGDN